MRIIHSRQRSEGWRGAHSTLQIVNKRRRRGELNNQTARQHISVGRCHTFHFMTRSWDFNHYLKTSIGNLHGKAGRGAASMLQ